MSRITTKELMVSLQELAEKLHSKMNKQNDRLAVMEGRQDMILRLFQILIGAILTAFSALVGFGIWILQQYLRGSN